MVKKIIVLVFTICFLGWICIILYDSMQSKNGQPKFCLSKEVKTYNDGSVEICHGLGYKVFSYNRANNKGVEFGPFWLEEKSISELKSLSK